MRRLVGVGEVAHEEDEEDIAVNVQGADIGVLVRLYAIHTKSVDCVVEIDDHLTLSPRSSHNVGSPHPEFPDTTLFVTVFSQNFQANMLTL